MTLFDLKGKIAVITGSTKGIGKAIAFRMAEHGAKVVVSSRKADACEAVTAEINETYGKGEEVAVSIPANISHKEQLQDLVDKTNAKWGQIDILVCNAAVNPYFGPSIDCPDEAFEKIMRCNVESNFWLTNMVLPQMKERGDGSVVIISSIGGLKGSTVLGAYAISKAADFQLARNIAVEYGPHGITANAIAPGLVKTDFARALWENPDILKASTAGSALRRIGEPDEIAGMAVLLASDAGRFLTGQGLVIDGGATITGG